MSIALPSTSKRSLGGLFGRKQKTTTTKSTAKKQLQRRDIAKLFSEQGHKPQVMPAKLNETEKQDRAALGNLRGALYSKD